MSKLWTSVKDGWNRAAAFAEAAASRGIVSIRRAAPEVKAQRWRSCHGEAGSTPCPPCPHRAYSEGGRFHYCDACGCGAKLVARLSAIGSTSGEPRPDPKYDKLDYPKLQCPIGAKGFSNERRDES